VIVHHPFVIRLGTLEVTGFGIGVLLAFWIARVIMVRELARRGYDASRVSDLLTWAVIGTLVGAKLYYVLIITRDWHDLYSRAGFVFWGGFIGALAVTSWYVHRTRLGFFRMSDVAAIAIAAGYSVGRTGCWAIGDDYGRPWTSRWAVQFPEGSPASTVANMASVFKTTPPPGTAPQTVLGVYPTQLYEVVLAFLMFLVLWRLRQHDHAEGWLFGMYLVLAGVERFAIEFFRAKDDRFFGPITTAQVVAVTVAAIGIYLLKTRRRSVA
jgi:phosphatidylglycerol:prolipoprotein diacylglycerol transferase